MRKRTKAREIVLQFLYQQDIRKDDWLSNIADFELLKEVEDDVAPFAIALMKGTLENISTLDDLIAKSAQNWQIKRMSAVDRNVLRLAAYELIHESDIPIKVSINEAINLAKKYGDEESGKFVNGILDKIKRDIDDGQIKTKS
ncbi:MAG: transcription antitermination factor NusB [Candidatus Kappaea frigidicola]|nr:transcription antitermination factor NusB [Candidatus Kappaea frigidicola]